jgi:hypothetical protein
VTEEGERLVMLGRGFEGGEEELPPPPPPPQDAKKHDVRAAKIEMVSRRERLVPGHAACLSFNMVDDLFLDSSGPLAPASSERVGVPWR